MVYSRANAPSTPIIEHVLAIAGARSIRSVAVDTGLGPTTLDRQLRGESPLRVETVNAICRHYGAPFLPAAVAAGWLSVEEAAREGADASIANATDRQLLEEVKRRVEASPHGHQLLTSPMG